MVLLFLIYMYHTDNLGKNLFGTCSVYLIIKITKLRVLGDLKTSHLNITSNKVNKSNLNL